MARTIRSWFRAPASELARRNALGVRLSGLTDAEHNYQLWRLGLLLHEAKACAWSEVSPPGLSEAQLAALVVEELAAVLPLLVRTGRLELLGLPQQAASTAATLLPLDSNAIDDRAADDVADLSGGDWL